MRWGGPIPPCAATCATRATLLAELNVLTRCDCTTRNEKQGGPAVAADGRSRGAHRRAGRGGGAGGDPPAARRQRGDARSSACPPGRVIGEAMNFLLESASTRACSATTRSVGACSTGGQARQRHLTEPAEHPQRPRSVDRSVVRVESQADQAADRRHVRRRVAARPGRHRVGDAGGGRRRTVVGTDPTLDTRGCPSSRSA